MTRYAMISAALFLAAPALAQDQVTTSQPADAPAAAEPSPAPDPSETARDRLLECSGEKFVFAWGAGARPTKVTLCGEEGATTEEVVRMLDDAAAKIEASGMPEDRRFAIVQQIRGKIAELEGAVAKAPPPAETPGQAQGTVIPPVERGGTSAVRPPAAAPAPSSAAPVAALPALARPRLTFECITPGEFAGGGPCVTLTRDTILTARAGEELSGATAIRFVRKGESRAEVALGDLRKGQSRRMMVPREVCSGVVTSEVEFLILRSGRVADTHGPFLLRC